MVSIVLVNSPADKAGIRANDLITKLNGFSVRSRRELTQSFDSNVVLTIKRGEEEKDYLIEMTR